jgi:hypothetical protein
MKQTFLKNHIEGLKSYTKEEFDNIDYELNLIDRAIIDVDLIRRDIVNQLGSPVHTTKNHTDWYLNHDGFIIKAMFVNGDNGRFKKLYLSSELSISEDDIYRIGESFKKEIEDDDEEKE